MKKTKLLPICGALASTAAIVTPLATSCSSWTRYTDMLSEYKPGVDSYKETWFDETTYQYDIDELYWERFEKNNDILRDDMLWSLSKVVRCDNSSDSYIGVLRNTFKKINKYNFDIHIDKVIPYDDDRQLYEPTYNALGEFDDASLIQDNSSIQFTIDWEFKAEYNQATRPTIGDRTIDVIDIDLTFKTIDPWIIWFEGDYWTDPVGYDLSIWDEDWIMSLYRPYVMIGDDYRPGMVCIDSDVEYRYATESTRAGDKWDGFNEHIDTRYLNYLIDDLNTTTWLPSLTEDSSAYTFMYYYLIWPLDAYVWGAFGSTTQSEESTNYFPFCSHYLQNVDYIETPEP